MGVEKLKSVAMNPRVMLSGAATGPRFLCGLSNSQPE